MSKSIEAILLALETINRLPVSYKIETFCFLICNAWELLLKAKIIKDDRDCSAIFYPAKDDHAKRSYSLSACLSKVLLVEDDHVRRNIERVIELRDKSVHFVIDNVPQNVLGLFQACVLNYNKKLEKWFNRSLLEHIPSGMMVILYNMLPDRFSEDSIHIKRKLSKDAAEFIAHYSALITERRHEIDISPLFRYSAFGRVAEGGFGYDGRAEQARYFGPSMGID